MPDQCKELMHSVNIWVFDGATGKTSTNRLYKKYFQMKNSS